MANPARVREVHFVKNAQLFETLFQTNLGLEEFVDSVRSVTEVLNKRGFQGVAAELRMRMYKTLEQRLTGAIDEPLLSLERRPEIENAATFADAFLASLDSLLPFIMAVVSRTDSPPPPESNDYLRKYNLRISDDELLARFEQVDGRSLQEIMNDLEGRQ